MVLHNPQKSDTECRQWGGEGTARPKERAAGSREFDPYEIRKEFPILARRLHERELVYLDNAATSQKPEAVLRAMEEFYRTSNANVHRGVHQLSQEATQGMEMARKSVCAFVGAADESEIIFTRGTTEGINLVAQTLGRTIVGPGDEVLVTAMEHHSNIVPWQMLVAERGARLSVVPITDDGSLDMGALRRLLSPRTKIVAFPHVSNALGTVNPIAEISAAAHAVGAIVLVDGAQGASHLRVDVREMSADFYAFSGHKVYAPTGIGALYGRRDLLEAMPPWQGGGDMIRTVSFSRSTWSAPPHKFEAGTPNIAGAIGLGAAIDWLSSLPREAVERHEADILNYGTAQLEAIAGLRLIGTSPLKVSVLSFVLDGLHPDDIGAVLDRRGIAIRTGAHCAQPVLARLGVNATARASLAVYNTRQDVDALVEALHFAKATLSRRA